MLLQLCPADGIDLDCAPDDFINSLLTDLDYMQYQDQRSVSRTNRNDRGNMSPYYSPVTSGERSTSSRRRGVRRRQHRTKKKTTRHSYHGTQSAKQFVDCTGKQVMGDTKGQQNSVAEYLSSGPSSNEVPVPPACPPPPPGTPPPPPPVPPGTPPPLTPFMADAYPVWSMGGTPEYAKSAFAKGQARSPTTSPTTSSRSTPHASNPSSPDAVPFPQSRQSLSLIPVSSAWERDNNIHL